MRRKAFALVLGAVAVIGPLVAGCSDDSDEITVRGVASNSVYDDVRSDRAAEGDPCSPVLSSAPFRAGVEIKILAADNVTLGITKTEPGKLGLGLGAMPCEYSWVVSGVPAGRGPYMLQASNGISSKPLSENDIRAKVVFSPPVGYKPSR